MKYIALTEKELDTLLWCVQNQAIKESVKTVKDGKSPSQNETIQILNEISKKVYIAMT